MYINISVHLGINYKILHFLYDILNTTVMEREFNKSFTTAALDSKFRGLRVYIIVLIKIKQNKVPPLIIFTTTRHNKYPGLEW